MPFPTTTAPLLLSPVVTVEFSGQLLISSDKVAPCEIGVNHFASKHELSICLIVSKPGMPPTMQPLCLNKLEADFSVTVDPPIVGSQGVTAYEPTSEPFKRDDPDNDDHDLRWAIDVNKLHPSVKLSTNEEGVKPCVRLSDGVLYSIARTDPDKLEVKLVCGSTTTDLISIATRIGAIIPLPGKRQVILEWSEPVGAQELLLPRMGDPLGTTYVVSIINEPPFGTPPDDELSHYYNVLQKMDDGSSIPVNQRCSLFVTSLSSDLKQGDANLSSSNPNLSDMFKTDEIPCMPVIGP